MLPCGISAKSPPYLQTVILRRIESNAHFCYALDKVLVVVQKLAGNHQKPPVFAGSGPKSGPLPSVYKLNASAEKKV
jgi:hypothetical protein